VDDNHWIGNGCGFTDAIALAALMARLRQEGGP
jgi:hypothetical protein